MKVLLVGIDRHTAKLLEQSGCLVERSEEVEEADDIVAYLETDQYDACIINLDIKNLGIFVCRAIRNKKIKTVIIGISSGGVIPWSEFRSLFLENGGDDLQKMPINPREVVAAVSASLRSRNSVGSDIITIPYRDTVLKINIPAFTVTVEDVRIDLTGAEYRMLITLARAVNRLLTKEQLLNSMYVEGIDDFPEIKIVDVFICKMRKKLNQSSPGLGSLIETVWGRGYMLASSSTKTNLKMPA
jgi:two-component system, cell cycle response regulator CtrA